MIGSKIVDDGSLAVDDPTRGLLFAGEVMVAKYCGDSGTDGGEWLSLKGGRCFSPIFMQELVLKLPLPGS